MSNTTARTRRVRCQAQGCTASKPLQLHKDTGKNSGHLTPEIIATFETGGWHYRTGSKGLCPDHNLLKDM